jgi:hypothetical protein
MTDRNRVMMVLLVRSGNRELDGTVRFSFGAVTITVTVNQAAQWPGGPLAAAGCQCPAVTVTVALTQPGRQSLRLTFKSLTGSNYH